MVEIHGSCLTGRVAALEPQGSGDDACRSRQGRSLRAGSASGFGRTPGSPEWSLRVSPPLRTRRGDKETPPVERALLREAPSTPSPRNASVVRAPRTSSSAFRDHHVPGRRRELGVSSYQQNPHHARRGGQPRFHCLGEESAGVHAGEGRSDPSNSISIAPALNSSPLASIVTSCPSVLYIRMVTRVSSGSSNAILVVGLKGLGKFWCVRERSGGRIVRRVYRIGWTLSGAPAHKLRTREDFSARLVHYRPIQMIPGCLRRGERKRDSGGSSDERHHRWQWSPC